MWGFFISGEQYQYVLIFITKEIKNMVSAGTALTTSNSARTGLTYVNILVTGATAQGLSSVVVDSIYMDDTMATTLRSSYGFNVTPLTDSLGSYIRYRISW